MAGGLFCNFRTISYNYCCVIKVVRRWFSSDTSGVSKISFRGAGGGGGGFKIFL